MQNNPIDQSIAEYLQQLKVAFGEQDAVLIQDAQYDAEEHLRAALEETDDPVATFKTVCEEYGSPEEIAEYYCDMETTVNFALNGVKKSNVSVRKNQFFGILADPHAYLAMLYMMLSLPIGMFCFAWVSIVGLGSLSFSILIIGVPVFLMFLGSMRLFSFFEGRLIEMLLGKRMPRRKQYQQTQTFSNKQEEWKFRLTSMLRNRRNWTTVLFLLLRLPLGFVYFAFVTAAAIMSLAVILSPIIDPILHAIDPINTIDMNWYWFPLAIPGGFIGFVLTLHISKLAGRFQAWLARYLLVSTKNDD